MPELAEVRWLVKNLQKELVGAEILSAEVKHLSVVQDVQEKPLVDLNSAAMYVAAQISLHQIIEIDRRGKFLLITTQHKDGSTRTLLSHLGFTGWWVPAWATVTSPRQFLHPMSIDHTKILLETTKGKLHLTDPRALSRLRVFPGKDAALQSRHLKNMGPDADSDAGVQALLSAFLRTNRRVRDVLLDQQIASGVGNYLVVECLYRAKLSGCEKSKALTSEQKLRIITAIKATVKLAETEENRDWWAVFQRKLCPLGHLVKRIALGSRGLYLCETCQGKWL